MRALILLAGVVLLLAGCSSESEPGRDARGSSGAETTGDAKTNDAGATAERRPPEVAPSRIYRRVGPVDFLFYRADIPGRPWTDESVEGWSRPPGIVRFAPRSEMDWDALALEEIGPYKPEELDPDREKEIIRESQSDGITEMRYHETRFKSELNAEDAAGHYYLVTRASVTPLEPLNYIGLLLYEFYPSSLKINLVSVSGFVEAGTRGVALQAESGFVYFSEEPSQFQIKLVSEPENENSPVFSRTEEGGWSLEEPDGERKVLHWIFRDDPPRAFEEATEWTILPEGRRYLFVRWKPQTFGFCEDSHTLFSIGENELKAIVSSQNRCYND